MTLRTKIESPAIYVWASVLALFAIALHWAHPGYVIAQSDINPPDRIWSQIQQCWLPWNYTQSYLGQPSSCFAYAPFLMVHGSLQTLLGASYAQALAFVTPVILGWLGVFYCARQFGCAPLTAFASAWAYALNPYTQVLLGLNITALLFAAIFPWICYCLLAAAKNPAERPRQSFVLAAVFSVAVATLAITPQLLIELAFGIAICFAISLLITDDRAGYLRWALWRVPLVSVVSLWWLVPVALSVLGAQNAHTTSLSANASYYERSSLLNNMRLNAVWLWKYDYYFPFAKSYDANPLTYGSGFLLIVGLIAGLWRLTSTRLQIARVAGIASLLIFFIAKGPHEPLPQVNYFIYSLPGLYAFIEPAGLIYIAVFFLAIVLALTLDDAESTAGSRLWKIAPAVCVFVAATSAYAVITGALFHGINENLPSMYTRIPSYWSAAAKAIEAAPQTDGVAVLPADPAYQAYYDWGYKGADTIPATLFNRRVLVLGPPFGYLSSVNRTSIYNKISALVDNKSPLLAPALRSLGVRFVVYRNDIIDAPKTVPLKELAAVLNARSTSRFGPLTIFDLGRPKATLSFSHQIIEMTGQLPAGSTLELAALQDGRPRLQVRDVPADSDLASIELVKGAPLSTVMSRKATAYVALSASEPANIRIQSPKGPALINVATSFAPTFDDLSRVPMHSLEYHAGLFSDIPISGIPLPVILPESWQPSGVEQGVTVFNPAARAIITGINIRLRSPIQRTMFLTVNGVRVKPGFEGISAKFRTALRAGSNNVIFDSGKRDQVSLVRPEDVEFAVPKSLVTLVPHHSVVLGSGLAHALVSTARFGANAEQQPRAWMSELTSSQGSLALVLQLRANGVEYLCYAPIHNWAVSDITSSIIDCAGQNRRYLSTTAIKDVEVMAVGVDATLYAASTVKSVVFQRDVSDLRLQWSDASTVGSPTVAAHVSSDEPNVVIGGRRYGIDVNKALSRITASATPITTSIDFSAMPGATLLFAGAESAPHLNSLQWRNLFANAYVAHVSEGGYLDTTIAFHPSWVAIQGPHFLRHIGADGWRNTWYVPSRGTVLIFNLLDCTMAALAVLALVTLILQARPLWRT
jgi:hypothetical protein